MTTVRELLVSIGVDVDERQLERVNAGFDTFGRVATAAAAVATAAFAAVASSLWQVVEAGSEAVDNAARLGITAEQYQEVAYAAEQMGTNIGALRPAMTALSRQVTALREGNEQAAESFGILGLSAADIEGKDTIEMLELLAERSASIEDPMQRAAIMQRVLGRGALELAPFLAGGADEMRRLRQEARDLGIVLDEDTAIAAESFGDDITRVKSVLRGFVFQVGSEVLPLVQDTVTQFLAWAQANRDVIRQRVSVWLDRIVAGFRGLYRVGVVVVGMLSTLATMLGGAERAAILAGVAIAAIVTASVIQSITSAISVLVALSRALNVANLSAIAAKASVIGFYAAVAAIGVALYVAYDQLTSFFSGQDSFLTRWVDRWEESSDTVFGRFARFLNNMRDHSAATIENLIDHIQYYAAQSGAILGVGLGDHIDRMEQLNGALRDQMIAGGASEREANRWFEQEMRSTGTVGGMMRQNELDLAESDRQFERAMAGPRAERRVDDLFDRVTSPWMTGMPSNRQPATINVDAPVTVEVPPGMMSPEGIGAAVQDGVRGAFDEAMLDALDADFED